MHTEESSVNGMCYKAACEQYYHEKNSLISYEAIDEKELCLPKFEEVYITSEAYGSHSITINSSLEQYNWHVKEERKLQETKNWNQSEIIPAYRQRQMKHE
ncbi:hypothetical protein AB6A40_010985 [Gnathostoma spinigerum]|uniref:Uncharacterized protein n=1 Tax=Gnathostoma spinigerum TaxID=75299 RepID=A0ABD6EWK2_9BILA